MSGEEQLPDLGESRMPAGCRINFHAGMGIRLCVESYEDVVARRRDAEPNALIEFRVLAGNGPKKAEVVRLSVEAQLVAEVLEVTDELEERWKEVEREQEEAQAQAGQGFMVQIPGAGGFRLG